MELMHNEVVLIAAGYLKGTYRVVLDEPRANQVIVVRLDPTQDDSRSRGGRKKKAVTLKPRKKAPEPLIGKLWWLNRKELEQLELEHQLLRIEIELDAGFFLPIESESDKSIFASRCKAARVFLNLERLREGILPHGGLGGLVKAAALESGLGETAVYKVWSLLCRYGFSETSLRPMRYKCGAPGVAKPCDPGGRHKAGRKTNGQRIAAAFGLKPPQVQPGMSTDWRNRILAADMRIPKPKPDMPIRINMILRSHFVTRYIYLDGKLVPFEPDKHAKRRVKKAEQAEVVEGELVQRQYPNAAQVRRVLVTELPRLLRLAQRTTSGHFRRSMRGMLARNWKDVPGPGHTWAIDSTIGDIYLRSSINAAWIIGRPVVYIIVDVWSTAIVGFFVCLRGPSWDMAKLALFSAASDPALIAQLWGYEFIPVLHPFPTLCAILLCDRGEYLSYLALRTGKRLGLHQLSYTPPYRPDLKGIVEVLHRITKDTQRQHFIPGAIDARRAEMELRRFHPDDGIFTVRQFVHYLQVIFTNYNLTADRSDRMDAHMIAARVLPSPAGLWRWGHAAGIGYRRSVSRSDLASSLLMAGTADVTRQGIKHAGCHYSNAAIDAGSWSAEARNFGGWSIPCYYYPGSVSRIWTPAPVGKGFAELTLCDQSRASEELCMDELLDAYAVQTLSRPDVDHVKAQAAVAALRKVERMVAVARAETAAAVARDVGPKPNMQDARTMEGLTASQEATSTSADAPHYSLDDSEQAHLDMVSALAASANEEVGLHD